MMHFTATAANLTVTAAGDLFQIQVPTDAVVRIGRVTITQNTEAGDSKSAQIRVRMSKVNGGTAGSGGTAVTPRPPDTGGPVSGTTCHANNTTDHTGTKTELHNESFNVMNGMDVVWLDDFKPTISPGDEFLVDLLGTIGDGSVDFDVTVQFEELGG